MKGFGSYTNRGREEIRTRQHMRDRVAAQVDAMERQRAAKDKTKKKEPKKPEVKTEETGGWKDPKNLARRQKAGAIARNKLAASKAAKEAQHLASIRRNSKARHINSLGKPK